jgi:trigger factor
VQVTVEKTGPCQAKVLFTVPGPTFQKAVKDALNNAGKNLNLKGFRPGHVPPQIVEKQYGKQIRTEAMQHFVNEAMNKAIQDNGLKVVGFQQVHLETLTVLEGSDFSHHIEISLRPEIALKSYKGVKVESQLAPVMDQEISGAIENLRQQQSVPEPAGSAGLAESGVAVGNVTWLIDGETVLSRENIRLTPKQPIPGCDAAAFAKALIGAVDGASCEVPLTVPQEFDKAELRGKSGICRIDVQQAYSLKSPTDQDLQKMVGAKDAADMQRIVREKIAEAKQQQEHQRLETAIIDALLGTHEFELPEMMVEQQTQARLGQFAQQLQQSGTPADQIQQPVDSQRGAATEASRKGVRALFLMQAIAEAEKLLVTQDDMRSEIMSIAQRNQAKPQDVADHFQKNNLFDQLAIELLERKVRKFLRENASVQTLS